MLYLDITFNKNTLFKVKIKKINTINKISNYIHNWLKEKYGKEVHKKLYYVFLSNLINKELYILKYLNLIHTLGNNSDLTYKNNVINIMKEYSNKVSFEAHRFKGLVRFKELKNNYFYSHISPDNNILPLISHHFYKRLTYENFIIHDSKRKQAYINDENIKDIVEIKKLDFDFENMYSKNEYFFQEIWKTYHKHLSIKERYNPNLQKQLMPKRYWKDLTEF